MDDLLRAVLDPSPPTTADSLSAWWLATATRRAAWPTTIDRALAGGACADRLGYAFAGGYAEALHALVPGSRDELTALCATEEGGAHPRAILTRLTPDDGGYLVTGRKRWATIATEASCLLVVASTGTDAGGKNRLRLVRVRAGAPGVRLIPASAPFVPEIPHAAVELERVRVTEADLLPGDGYDDYLKPFRTIEDLHVHAALLGYLLGVSRRHGFAPERVEQLLALAITTRALAAAPVTAPTTHLALAGVLDLVGAQVELVEQEWSAAPDDEWSRWQRDRGLLRVAGAARAARRERARADVAGAPGWTR